MNTRAATRYAKALLELASESNLEDVVQKDMQDIALSISGSIDLQQVIKSPILKNSDKKAAIDVLFGKNVNAITSKMFGLLADNKRLDLLQDVSNQYTVLFNNKKGIVKAVVTTAIALDEALKTKVLSKAKELVGDKQIQLENKIDEKLIGGFVLRIGDVQIDASITNKLNKLRRELVENH
jgi:F-type H+-transporting ATPase subunit delta